MPGAGSGVELAKGAVGAAAEEAGQEARAAGSGEAADSVSELDFETKVTGCGSLIGRCLHGLAPVGLDWLPLRRRSGRWAGAWLKMASIVGTCLVSGPVLHYSGQGDYNISRANGQGGGITEGMSGMRTGGQSHGD